MNVLAVDDEPPALAELDYLLHRIPEVDVVRTAPSAAEALRILHEHEVDVVVSDIGMPGLTGVELAKVLRRFARPPAIVFVTAHDEHAVEAFDLGVADYVLKPVRAERLAAALRRCERLGAASSETDSATPTDVSIPVELAGVTRLIKRSEIRYVEAHGDYCRLHTDAGAFLVRTPLTTLEQEWGEAGFVRIHRSLLVALRYVDQVRMAGGRCSVVVAMGAAGAKGPAELELTVARRHTRALRETFQAGRTG